MDVFLVLLIYVMQWLFPPFPAQFAEPPPGYGVPHRRFIVSPEWEKLFSAGRNLTVLYKNPSSGYGGGHELVRTAVIYLDELEQLEKAVDDNRFRSLDAVWELYLNGGPLHLKQIPYDKFITTYKWDSNDIDEYYTVIDDTRRVWSRLVEELEILAESDVII